MTNDQRKFSRPFLIAALLIATQGWVGSETAVAQLDRVTPLDGKAISGSIQSVAKDGITIKVGNNTEKLLPGDIEKIALQGDPSALTKGREFAVDGEYEQALEELRKIDIGSLKRDASKADAAYYLLLCEVKSALAGRGNKTKAASAAVNYVRTYPDSWHYYSVQRLTGDLALALNKHDQAISFYERLRAAPSTNTKIESVYLTAVAMLAKGESASALDLFDKVIGLKVQSPSSLRLQLLAKAGKAVAMARMDRADEGLALVDALIEEMGPADVEMGARIYNAQGASYEAKGDDEGAILAYLHTHLMFSGQPDAHAHALTRLVDLWPKVGKPQRAAEAKQELQQRYPGYGR
tara:strand:- start:87154 stop:88206 length:1053 start_codon:yes stop_codon:yes gene_type:complete